MSKNNEEKTGKEKVKSSLLFGFIMSSMMMMGVSKDQSKEESDKQMKLVADTLYQVVEEYLQPEFKK